MEIWTNGTISPQMALVEAAKILRKHLNPFVQYTEPGPEVALDEPIEIGAAAAKDTVDIDLERKLILRSPDELLEVRNFGETTLREVQAKLQERGLSLGMRVPPRRG